MDTISFKRHRFPPEIIRRAVWLLARFTLSYRDVEDLLAERGLDISYESVRRLSSGIYATDSTFKRFRKDAFNVWESAKCGHLKGNPCGPLRPNTINVTMPQL